MAVVMCSSKFPPSSQECCELRGNLTRCQRQSGASSSEGKENVHSLLKHSFQNERTKLSFLTVGTIVSFPLPKPEEWTQLLALHQHPPSRSSGQTLSLPWLHLNKSGGFSELDQSLNIPLQGHTSGQFGTHSSPLWIHLRIKTILQPSFQCPTPCNSSFIKSPSGVRETFKNLFNVISFRILGEACPVSTEPLFWNVIYFCVSVYEFAWPQFICGGQRALAGINSLLLPREAWGLSFGCWTGHRHLYPPSRLTGP